MAALSAWTFSTAGGADAALATLARLQDQQLIAVHDAAVVSWPEGAKKPQTRQEHDLTKSGALGGAFWGLLFGLIFFVPLLGLAVGAGAGALGGSLAHAGIDDAFLEEVREQVTPGTSALFALTSHAELEPVAEAFRETHAVLIQTNLSPEDEAVLRAAFPD